jgi:hypothetical protein
MAMAPHGSVCIPLVLARFSNLQGLKCKKYHYIVVVHNKHIELKNKNRAERLEHEVSPPVLDIFLIEEEGYEIPP